MPKESDVAEPRAGTASRAGKTADDVIAACDGDARAAVAALLEVVDELADENRALRRAASPGFARRRPMVFRASS